MNLYLIGHKKVVARTEDDAILQYRFKKHLIFHTKEQHDEIPRFKRLRSFNAEENKVPPVIFIASLGDIPSTTPDLDVGYLKQLNSGIETTNTAWNAPAKKRPSHAELIFKIGHLEFIVYNRRFDLSTPEIHQFVGSIKYFPDEFTIKNIDARLVRSNFRVIESVFYPSLYQIDRVNKKALLIGRLPLKKKDHLAEVSKYHRVSFELADLLSYA